MPHLFTARHWMIGISGGEIGVRVGEKRALIGLEGKAPVASPNCKCSSSSSARAVDIQKEIRVRPFAEQFLLEIP